MCHLFTAALYSHFSQLRGQDIAGLVGGGVRGWAQILSSIQGCPRLRIKYFILKNLSSITFLSLDGFCAIYCNFALLSCTELCLSTWYCWNHYMDIHTLEKSSCLWQGASRFHSPDSRLTSLLRMTELHHNTCVLVFRWGYVNTEKGYCLNDHQQYVVPPHSPNELFR